MSTPPTLEPHINPVIELPLELPEIKEEPIKTVEVSSDVRCNCWLYQKTVWFPDLQGTDYILSHLTQEVGEMVVFYYDKSGLYHYGKVISNDGVNLTVDDSNYHHCEITVRTVPLNSKDIIGYFNP